MMSPVEDRVLGGPVNRTKSVSRKLCSCRSGQLDILNAVDKVLRHRLFVWEMVRMSEDTDIRVEIL